MFNTFYGLTQSDQPNSCPAGYKLIFSAKQKMFQLHEIFTSARLEDGDKII